MLCVQFCRRLKQLLLDFAGGHGPVKDKYIYDVMCRSEGFLLLIVVITTSIMTLYLSPQCRLSEQRFSTHGSYSN